MFKINIEGIRAKQYRLFHSKKFRGFNFIKLRNELKDKDDLQGLNELITEYLVEDNEKDYTSYLVFLTLATSLIFMVVILMLVGISNFIMCLSLLVSSFVFFLISNKKKNDFVLGEMGIDISDDYFKQKIKEKFNL